MSVEKLAALLGKEPDVVEKAVEEGNLDSLVTEFQQSHQIFTNEELSKKLDNHFRSEIEKLGEKSELPPNVYNVAKANAFAKLEKEWAREFGVEKWDSITDLRDKIIASKESGDDNEALEKANARIEELKQQVLESEKLRDAAVKEAESKFHRDLIERDLQSIITGVPIDAEDETLENQRRILKTMLSSEYEFAYRDGQTVVIKDGNPLTNKVGDPLPLAEVVKEFAPKYVNLKGDPEGGRGGRSTETKKLNGAASIKTADDFWEYLDKEGIRKGSAEMLDLMVQVKEANPSINL
jgi:hypothetical protein